MFDHWLEEDVFSTAHLDKEKRDIGKELVENAKKSWGKSLIVIPARMASKRLPGKPLLMAGGQALVHWTYAQAKQTKADHVVVATPDKEIGRYCQENDITWMATAEDHPNGTSRCWEIVQRSKAEFQRIINWQADEPCIPFEAVNLLIDWGIVKESIETLVCPSPYDIDDPNCIKVVHSKGRCHWFSRAPMRGARTHVGIYSFVPSILSKIVDLEPSIYAMEESLEQLAWVEAGIHIHPIVIDEIPLSINTQSDWEKFKQSVEEK